MYDDQTDGNSVSHARRRPDEIRSKDARGIVLEQDRTPTMAIRCLNCQQQLKLDESLTEKYPEWKALTANKSQGFSPVSQAQVSTFKLQLMLGMDCLFVEYGYFALSRE